MGCYTCVLPSLLFSFRPQSQISIHLQSPTQIEKLLPGYDLNCEHGTLPSLKHLTKLNNAGSRITSLYYRCSYSRRRNFWLHQDRLSSIHCCWSHSWNLSTSRFISSVAVKCIADIWKYMVGGYRIQNKQTYGVELALLASIILAGSSIPRALRSQKPLPTGLSLLALYGLYTFGNAYRLKL